VLEIHQKLSRSEATKRAIELLRQVGVPASEKRIMAFPHELSGGMAQRVMIAMALACSPELLLADEPTTALDVTIQAQILDLMRKLRDTLGSAVVLITHDLGVVAEMCERVIVMYAGRVVEQADVKTLFANPSHPYTQGLLGAIPVMGMVKEQLEVIPGTVPNLINPPVGCRFAPRCKVRVETGCTRCTEEEPELLEVAPGQKSRCWVAQKAC
jgi:oligopeptide/dipeptide ABC transporter ATP-binding protein